MGVGGRRPAFSYDAAPGGLASGPHREPEKPRPRRPFRAKRPRPILRPHAAASPAAAHQAGPCRPGRPGVPGRFVGRAPGCRFPPGTPVPAVLGPPGGVHPPVGGDGGDPGHRVDPVAAQHECPGGGRRDPHRLADRAGRRVGESPVREAPPSDLGPGDPEWHRRPLDSLRRGRRVRARHRQERRPRSDPRRGGRGRRRHRGGALQRERRAARRLARGDGGRALHQPGRPGGFPGHRLPNGAGLTPPSAAPPASRRAGRRPSRR